MTEWIDLTCEEPFDPGRRIVDCHHHLWAEGQRTNAATYSGGDEPPYLPQHLHADMDGHNFIGSIFVECGIGYRSDGPEHLRSVGETEFVAAQVELALGKGPPILGIVSDIDLALVDVLCLEARAGIEPAYTDLQSAASPLRHRASEPGEARA